MFQPTVQPKCENKYWQTIHQACEETILQEQEIPQDFHPKHFEAKLLLRYQRRKHHHKQHDSKVLSKTNDKNNRKCNFKSKSNCQLNDECLTQCLAYKLISTTFDEGEFKARYNNHTKLFIHRECMNETELSKHVWNLKDHGFDNNLP